MKTISPSCTHGSVSSTPLGHGSLEADCDQLELLLDQVDKFEADEARIDSEIEALVKKKKSMHSELLLLIKKIAKIASALSEARQHRPSSGLRTYKGRRVNKDAESRESLVDQRKESEPLPTIVTVESLASSNRNRSGEKAVASSLACKPSTSSNNGAISMQVGHQDRLNEPRREFHNLNSQEDSELVNQKIAKRNDQPRVTIRRLVFCKTEAPQLETVIVKDETCETNLCTGGEVEVDASTDGPPREKRRRVGGSGNSRVEVKEEAEILEPVEDPLDAHLNEIPTTIVPLGFASISKAVVEELAVSERFWNKIEETCREIVAATTRTSSSTDEPEDEEVIVSREMDPPLTISKHKFDCLPKATLGGYITAFFRAIFGENLDSATISATHGAAKRDAVFVPYAAVVDIHQFLMKAAPSLFTVDKNIENFRRRISIMLSNVKSSNKRKTKGVIQREEIETTQE